MRHLTCQINMAYGFQFKCKKSWHERSGVEKPPKLPTLVNGQPYLKKSPQNALEHSLKIRLKIACKNN